MISQVQENIVFVFNRILINFFKEIKKEQYFKLAIKKNYKVIDKKNHKYINYYSKKMLNNIELLCEPELNLTLLENNEEFTNVNIFKNINIGKLFRNYKGDKDQNIILSYILTLSLLNLLYEDSKMIIDNKENDNKRKENILNQEDVESNDEDKENVLDDGDDDSNDEDNDNSDDEDNDEDNEEDSSDDEISQEDLLNTTLTKSLKILSSIDNNVDIDSDLNEIMDDDIKILLTHIKDLKVDVTNNEKLDNGSLEDLFGNSKIGKLAKEISSNIDLESLNINTENPEEMLNPANLFSGENGNMIGNLVQQVGSSITEKMNSGELKQEDLIKDAFSLMNKMQNTGSENPVIDSMVKNMMSSHQKGDKNAEMPEMDINSIMQQMMGGMGEGGGDGQNMMQQMMAGMGGGGGDGQNMMQQMMAGMGGGDQNMMQQMMNSMGGTKAMNQNNPTSREGKTKERLRKKLDEKNKNAESV